MKNFTRNAIKSLPASIFLGLFLSLTQLAGTATAQDVNEIRQKIQQLEVKQQALSQGIATYQGLIPELEKPGYILVPFETSTTVGIPYDSDTFSRILAAHVVAGDMSPARAAELTKALLDAKPQYLAASKKELANLQQQLTKTDDDLSYYLNERARLSEAASVDVSGTWTDGVGVTIISTSGGSLSASFTYKAADYSGSGSWTNCTVQGNTAKCDWTASHDDTTKSGNRKGTLTVTLSADSITGSYFEQAPEWNYKPGYSASNVNSSMYDGAVHAINLKRQ